MTWYDEERNDKVTKVHKCENDRSDIMNKDKKTKGQKGKGLNEQSDKRTEELWKYST